MGFFSGIVEEDRILRVLTNLYNSDRLLLPSDSYNGKILPELKDLYRNLFDEAILKLKDEEVFSLKSAKIRMFIPYYHLYYFWWNSIARDHTFLSIIFVCLMCVHSGFLANSQSALTKLCPLLKYELIQKHLLNKEQICRKCKNFKTALYLLALLTEFPGII